MNTSKYSPEDRKTLKRFQRTPAYQQFRQEVAQQRTALEAKLKEQSAIIAKLAEKLVDAGVDKDEVAKLAA
jgi:hypothetical protein